MINPYHQIFKLEEEATISSVTDALLSILKDHQRFVYDSIINGSHLYYTVLKARQRGLSCFIIVYALISLIQRKDVRIFTYDLAAARDLFNKFHRLGKDASGNDINLIAILSSLGVNIKLNQRPYEVHYDYHSITFNSFSGKDKPGGSFDVMIFDEAAKLPQEFFDGIQPSISAQSNPRVLMVGTPEYKVGPFYEHCSCNLPGTLFINLHAMRSQFKDYDAMLNQEVLEHDRASMTHQVFLSEYEAQWRDADSDIFPDLSQCYHQVNVPDESLILGVDPGYGNGDDYTSVIALGIVSGRVYDAWFSNSGGRYAQSQFIGSVFMGLKQQGCDIHSVAIEGNALGVAFVEEFRMQYGSQVNAVYDERWSQFNKTSQIDQLASDLEKGRVKLPDPSISQGAAMLTAHFQAMVKHQQPGSLYIQYDAPSGKHDDGVAAVVHANHIWHQHYQDYVSGSNQSKYFARYFNYGYGKH